MQVPFLKFLPVTINVGIWAFVWLWVGLQYGLVLWIPFISWSMWYIIGPTWTLRKKRFPKNLIGAISGTIYAIAFILLIPAATEIFGPYGIPALGFLAGMTIVLLELTNWFEYAMSYFFTFGGYFAYAFGGSFGAAGDYASIFQGSIGALFGYTQDVVYFLALILAGFLLGFITDFFRYHILKAEGLGDESMQKTIFDKEAPIQ